MNGEAMSNPVNMLGVLINAQPGQDEAFNEWYSNVHVPDVLAIPSFVNARRFSLGESKPDTIAHSYVTIYEVTGTAEEAIADLTEAFMTGRLPVDRECCDAAGIQLLPMSAIMTAGF
jgi:hypothetical protein